MTRIRLMLLIFWTLTLIGGLGFVAPAHAQTKEYRYDLIDVSVAVGKDGILHVRETMRLRYSGGPFRSANRSIALNRLDDVRNISLSEGAKAYTKDEGSAKTPGTFVVERDSSAATVRWYYDPTSDATRTFTLRYNVAGAIRTGSSVDELWWVAIFPDRTVPVNQSRVVITLPAGADIKAGAITLPAADGTVTVDKNTVTVVRTTELAAGEALEVQVPIPAALIESAKPQWQMTAAQPAPTRKPWPTTTPSSSRSSSNSSGFDGGFCFGILFLLFAVGIWVYNGVTTGDWSSGSSGNSYRSNSSYSSSRSSSSSSRSSSSSSSSSSRSSGGSGGGGGGAE